MLSHIHSLILCGITTKDLSVHIPQGIIDYKDEGTIFIYSLNECIVFSCEQ